MIVRDYLEKQAKERPTKPAILFKEEKITFSQLNTLSNRLANRLLNVGVKKGDRIVLLFQNCPEFCVAYFAILKIGAIAVVLDFRLSPAEMEPIFQEAEVSAIITNVRQKVFIDRVLKTVPTLQHIVVTGAQGKISGIGTPMKRSSKRNPLKKFRFPFKKRMNPSTFIPLGRQEERRGSFSPTIISPASLKRYIMPC